MSYDAILARDVEAHYGRSESIEDRVADELGTDCGREIESGDPSCDDWVKRRPSCCECDMATRIAGDLAEWSGVDGGEAGVRVREYLDARDARRAARARMARELADDCDPDGYRGAA